ncbi:serine hydrolase [Sphingorhabdus sp.]|uniref:serine hydrolase n=1 Tax=Sphingorhabdus sp. TaxID=1902408 RepID=UPI00348548E2
MPQTRAKPGVVVTQPAPPPVQRKAEPPKVVRAAVPEQLMADIDLAWRQFPGRTGIAVQRIDGDWITGKRFGEFFPQQSVSKMWVAMTILDQVDSGRLRLDQKVKITMSDLAVFHQPIRERVVANGAVEETIQSLMEQAITASDNTANDSLLRTAGGPEAVRNFIERKKLGKIRFGPGERLMQSQIAGLSWQQEYSIGRRFYTARSALPRERRQAALEAYLADPVDGAAPEAISNALARLAKGELLSPASTRLLLGMMERTKSGPNRLKAGVPAGWRFGHKTGTGQELDPLSTGYNDIGIMTAPDGTRYAVVVMIASTTSPIPARMAMMQAVSRAVATHHR